MSLLRICAIAILALSGLPALAGEPSTDEIVCKLDPHCPFSKPGFRKLEITGSIPDDPLTVNLYVNFPYDSADLGSDARITLDKLGQALRDQRLASFAFSIVGHTDAKGADEYNRKLSERRAASVEHCLVQSFGIEPSRLTSKGMGKLKLLDPSHPEDGVNRRVQVLNVTVINQQKDWHEAGQEDGIDLATSGRCLGWSRAALHTAAASEKHV